MKVISCCICGVAFSTKHHAKKTCGDSCSYRNRLNVGNARNRDRYKNDASFRDHVLRRERESYAESPERKRGNAKKWSSENKERRRELSETWRHSNKSLVAQRSRARNYKDPKLNVKEYLSKSLGFTPPPELVEEATALRLLRRAIKKAGE